MFKPQCYVFKGNLFLPSTLKMSLVDERLIMYKTRKYRNTAGTKWNAFLLVYCTKTALLIKYIQYFQIPPKAPCFKGRQWLGFISAKFRHTAKRLFWAGHLRLPLWSMKKSRHFQRTSHLLIFLNCLNNCNDFKL